MFFFDFFLLLILLLLFLFLFFVFLLPPLKTLGETGATGAVAGAGAVEAGNGLSRSGTTLSVNVGNTLQIASDTVNIKGVTSTATGDIILGSGGANGGYSRLAVGSTDQMLKVSGGTLVYTDTIDGGTFT